MSFVLKGKSACWVVPEYRLVEIRMIGFWTEEEAGIITEELRHHMHQASDGGKNSFKVVLDATEFQTQTEVVREIIVKKGIVYGVNLGMEKSARIVSQAASQMQFHSMGKDANSLSEGRATQFREFYSRGEALAWLGLPFFLPQDFTQQL